ncbi:MAG: hypothetical protein J3K34DRAFT_415549 [Monoraphidium minutum]|nr:MAG: hypothetical protein J3K34DRAFT_415549 [Monoraphidium minutum]
MAHAPKPLFTRPHPLTITKSEEAHPPCCSSLIPVYTRAPRPQPLTPRPTAPALCASALLPTARPPRDDPLRSLLQTPNYRPPGPLQLSTLDLPPHHQPHLQPRPLTRPAPGPAWHAATRPVLTPQAPRTPWRRAVAAPRPANGGHRITPTL